MASNNPPTTVTLELDPEQAKFLLENCDKNIFFALSLLGQGGLKRPGLEKLVTTMEKFRAIRVKLIAQGVRPFDV